MNKRADVKTAIPVLTKLDPSTPALAVLGSSVIIRAGTTFAGNSFGTDAPVPLPDGGLTAGVDYVVSIAAGSLALVALAGLPDRECHLGGFHFAPGGNAPARAGGDSVPAGNPCSAWDWNFRPVCPNPRGMALDRTAAGKPFWYDLYPLCRDHLAGGTSQFGVTIADGRDPPQKPGGGYFKRLDCNAAVAVMAHHGKGLLSIEERFAAAYGVTERTAHRDDPRITKLDAPRTSRSGGMQMAGNMWEWGHDGDPDEPVPTLFGGDWGLGANSGSRASLWDISPAFSYENIGARGRCDHLCLV